jgi:hypothetical protein
MEAARTSETLVNFYQTTQRYNPEDSHLPLLVVFLLLLTTSTKYYLYAREYTTKIKITGLCHFCVEEWEHGL